MEAKGELLHSRSKSFRLSSAQWLHTTMHFKVSTVRSQIVNRNSLLISIWPNVDGTRLNLLLSLLVRQYLQNDICMNWDSKID